MDLLNFDINDNIIKIENEKKEILQTDYFLRNFSELFLQKKIGTDFCLFFVFCFDSTFSPSLCWRV